MPRNVAGFYRGFETKLRMMGFKKEGDAEHTIHYSANGEASDWMLHEHGILAFSPELGDDRKRSLKFYPARESIAAIIDYDYRAISLFLDYCTIRPVDI